MSSSWRQPKSNYMVWIWTFQLQTSSWIFVPEHLDHRICRDSVAVQSPCMVCGKGDRSLSRKKLSDVRNTPGRARGWHTAPVTRASHPVFAHRMRDSTSRHGRRNAIPGFIVERPHRDGSTHLNSRGVQLFKSAGSQRCDYGSRVSQTAT